MAGMVDSEDEDIGDEGDAVINGVALSDDEADSDVEEAEAIAQMKEDKRKADAKPARGDKAGKGGKGGFEVVRAVEPEVGDGSDDSASSDSEDEFESLTDNQKSEVMALARKMLRSKDKRSVMEAAYNKYAFHDDGLPDWFREDEDKFNRPIEQVTPEEIEAEKERLRAIDARPLKKVAEAKARKKRRVAGIMAKAKAKAISAADQEDISMKARMREVERIYAKAKGQASSAQKGKGKRKGPPLDARMRADLRGQKKADRKKGIKRPSGGRVSKRSIKGYSKK